MKLNKQILEAIQHGVNLAIDDFDDIQNIDTQKIGKIHNTSGVIREQLIINTINKINKQSKEPAFFHILLLGAYLDNKLSEDTFKMCNLQKYEIDSLLEIINSKNVFSREYVDLNLPSGNLWCSKNLGSEDPIDLGNTYYWATLEKNEDEPGYRWFMPLPEKYKIYEDNKTASGYMDKADDPAYNINQHYRTPSMEDFKELYEYTNVYLTANGLIFISKENPLNFIVFNQQITLYMTSNIENLHHYHNRVKSVLINSKRRSDVSCIFGMTLIRNGQPELSTHLYKILNQDYGVPPTVFHIRPIYSK